MKSKTTLILFFSLILTVCFLTQVHAVDDAEFEALEKQIEQLEKEEKQKAEAKKKNAEVKRKAEAEKKRLAELERQRQEEQKRVEEEKIQIAEEIRTALLADGIDLSEIPPVQQEAYIEGKRRQFELKNKNSDIQFQITKDRSNVSLSFM